MLTTFSLKYFKVAISPPQPQTRARKWREQKRESPELRSWPSPSEPFGSQATDRLLQGGARGPQGGEQRQGKALKKRGTPKMSKKGGSPPDLWASGPRETSATGSTKERVLRSVTPLAVLRGDGEGEASSGISLSSGGSLEPGSRMPFFFESKCSSSRSRQFPSLSLLDNRPFTSGNRGSVPAASSARDSLRGLSEAPS